MNDVIQNIMPGLATFLLYAVTAMAAQNAVFTRGLGISRLVSLMGDASDLARTRLCIVLSLVQVCTVPLAWLCNRWLLGWKYYTQVQPLVYVLCTTVVCLALWLLLGIGVSAARRGGNRAKMQVMLPIAGFNTSVLGTLLVTTTQSYTLVECLGFALGSGIGYWAAVELVWEAQRRLLNRNIPAAFRGLPITLLYIGILALALYAFTGHTVFF